jgi:hypothetical protein
MNILRRHCLPLSLLLGAGTVVLLAGCIGIFQTKQRVVVDSISAPGTAKPTGQSYRLVARKSVVTGIPVQIPVIKACLDAALIRSGLYEAPPAVPSDIFIEINFGMDTTTRIDASARESFLQLSARANRKRGLDTSQEEEELWDVRVSLTGLAGRFETAMPLLATVAGNYLGTDTHVETVLEIPENSPEVAGVRETALTALRGMPPPATQAAAAAASSAPK